MSPNERAALTHAIEMTFHEVMAAASGRLSTAFGQAIFKLTTHIAGHWKTISVLSASGLADAGVPIMNSCAVLTRCMYDALLQELYISSDPALAEERGSDYLDFEVVDHHQFLERILDSDHCLSRRLAHSPDRNRKEDEIRERFENVKHRFTAPGKDSPRHHWYAGTLRSIAEAVDRDDDYFWHFTYSNSAVHAGAYSSSRGSLFPSGDAAFLIATSIAGQAMLVLHSELELALEESSFRLLEVCAKDPLSAITVP